MNPTFRLIDKDWDKVLEEAVATKSTELWVVCPFIKLRTVRRLLAGKCLGHIQVITRFHLGEMCMGVNDVEALRMLIETGAKVRGVKGLHAKLYLFGDQRAVVTSANLTEAALLRNHEFGFVSSESHIIQRCREYFAQLWQRSGSDLDLDRLGDWERKLTAIRLAGSPPSPMADLKDEGTDAGLVAFEPEAPTVSSDSPGAYVKFFGVGSKRGSNELPVLQEVKESGSHWACTYPENKRPRSVRDGDVMFMGRLVGSPNDISIYGRAIGLRHIDQRDVAIRAEVVDRPWKQDWPAYVRVHSGEFIAGTLKNGVKLSTLMDELKSDAFASTQRNARSKNGQNTDPRRALMQKAHVKLTNEAFAWLEHRLQQAFRKYGKITPAELESLDWPAVQDTDLKGYISWSMHSEARKEGTAKEYAYFLERLMKHYPEQITPTTVPNEAAADQMVGRLMDIVRARGRWIDGAFNERDITQNVRPALRAYGRYCEAGLIVGRPT